MKYMQDSRVMGNQQKQKRVQAGLTLVELMVSIGLLVLIAGYFVTQRIEAVKVQKAESIAQELMTVAAISTSFYINNKVWPDQAGDCNGLLSDLQAANVFPSGYSPFSGISFASDCDDNSTAADAGFGQVLRLTLSFPYVDREYASLVASMIPASDLNVPAPTPTNPAPGVTVEHYLFPPRKHTLPPFQLLDLDSNGRITVRKPSCISEGLGAQYMLIPQALCLTDPTGFGGYYFDVENVTSDEWRFQLFVTPGGNRDFTPMTQQCDLLEPNKVGVITYCG